MAGYGGDHGSTKGDSHVTVRLHQVIKQTAEISKKGLDIYM